MGPAMHKEELSIARVQEQVATGLSAQQMLSSCPANKFQFAFHCTTSAFSFGFQAFNPYYFNESVGKHRNSN